MEKYSIIRLLVVERVHLKHQLVTSLGHIISGRVCLTEFM